MLTHLEPQDPKNWKNMLNVRGPKNTVNYRGFCRHAHPTRGRRQGRQLLSPTERRETPYGYATARGPLAGFKRLRATAGQGPNYVGPSCGYTLAYVGLMLTRVEPKDPKNGNSKKRCKTQDILMVGGLSWGYVGPSWGHVGLS